MAGRKSDFTLTKLDDLFSTQEQRDEEKLSKIRDIPLTEIDDFPDHPFKVRDDEDMAQLIESIKERGVITPATVRQKEDGRYELISGHRRNSDSYSRADMGFQAVCIGYMLCKKYGVDTQNFAINRIPEKLAGKEPKDIRYELSKTRNAMADIHSRVSDELYKKKQERSKDYER